MNRRTPRRERRERRKQCGSAGSLAAVMLMAGVLTQEVKADDPQNLLLKGTLVEPPPCRLDEDGTVTVSFGERVGVKKVASGIYRQPVPLTLVCEDEGSNEAWQLVLSVRGTPADFDTEKASVVTAEQSALGVKLYAGGEPFVLETPLKVNGTTLPEVEAVLVQEEGSSLAEGSFTAQATLRAEYQ